MRPDEMIRRALDGELDGPGTRRLEALLQERPDLRRSYERLSELKRDLRSMAQAEPAAGLSERVMKDILTQRRLAAVRHPSGLHWARRLAYGVVTAAACVFSAWLGYAVSRSTVDLAGWVPDGPSLYGPAGVPVRAVARPSAESVCPVSTRVRFALKAPGARSVSVVGDFNGWSAQTHPLRDEDGDGVWSLTLTLRPGVYQYNLLVDGSRWVPDPAAETFRPDGFGGVNSVLRL